MGSIDKTFEKLEKLEKEYLKMHPNSKPLGPMLGCTIEGLVDLYENANGREIIWKDDPDPEVLDGGGYEYVDE